jgi:hypothetical protein
MHAWPGAFRRRMQTNLDLSCETEPRMQDVIHVRLLGADAHQGVYGFEDLERHQLEFLAYLNT